MSNVHIRRVFYWFAFVFPLLEASSRSLAQESQAHQEDGNRLVVEMRSREAASQESNDDYLELRRTSRWEAQKTAIIVCDMWDDHTCKGAAGRVAEMAPAVDRTIKAARQKGVFVIHAPSGTMSVYEEMPQRRRAVAAAFSKAPIEIKWNHWDEAREGKPLTAITHGGCGCVEPCPHFDEDEDGIRQWKGEQVPWTRQIETIEIDAADAISDNGQEIFNMLEERGIDNVILMGVHTNICVSGRPFGLRQMAYFGKNVVLCRDLTDALLQARVPGIDQFRGTELIVEHIEKHICPTITSASITGEEAFRFAERDQN